MSEKQINIFTDPIILTTGLYDLLKDLIRRRKLEPENEKNLTLQLKTAVQVLRKDLPANVVTVGKAVTILDLATGDTSEYKFAAAARKKNGTTSIQSNIGIALVGYPEGAVLEWVLEGVRRKKQILRVAPLI